VTVVPASATFDEIMAHEPDGFFLSNGPGDPAATGDYAVPVIRQMLATKKPLFGICLGHQMLALAVGGMTSKMFQGHRGANHPVKRLADGRVEITSMNHGFAVKREGLPENVRETHVSLFDGSNCGIELTDRPAFSVQYHPEASPGPQDSFYLFEKFVGAMTERMAPKTTNTVASSEVVSFVATKNHRELRKRLKEADETLALMRRNRRARTRWLEPTAPVPRELAAGLVRASAWWHTHSSGSPVRAPGHADRIIGNETTWRVEFGANSFLAARAIHLSKNALNDAYDQLEAGGKPDVAKLKRGLRLAMQRSVSNVNGDLYDLYPTECDEMMFGAQSIDVDDAVNFILRESGLATFLKSSDA
jgi:anthranilate/para-aminobenzoate synthase component II